MSDFRIDKITDRSGESGTSICGIATFSGTHGMVMPNGPSTYRGGRGRGVFYGGSNPIRSNVIDYIEIATAANAVDFGDAPLLVTYAAACGSTTRGVFIGGEETSGTPGYNEMRYVNFSSKGGAYDFGKLDTNAAYRPLVCSNDVRGVINFGYGCCTDAKLSGQDYITIASKGNGSFWGDLTQAGCRWYGADCSSPTRGVYMGGIQSCPGIYNSTQGTTPTTPNCPSTQEGIDYMTYLTYATFGSQYDFGQCSQLARYSSGSGSSTRGVFAVGSTAGTPVCVNTIEYITIASTGDSTDFGDLTVERVNTTSTSSHTRAVWGGGYLKPSPHAVSDVIDYVTIATTGNATDFGNLTEARGAAGATSDCQGGIG